MAAGGGIGAPPLSFQLPGDGLVVGAAAGEVTDGLVTDLEAKAGVTARSRQSPARNGLLVAVGEETVPRIRSRPTIELFIS